MHKAVKLAYEMGCTRVIQPLGCRIRCVRNNSSTAVLPSVVMFPGQGSQKVGMGKDFLDIPAARLVFEEIDEALKEKLSRTLFEGPENDLTLTANAQPALLAFASAAFNILKSRLGADFENGIKAVMGHSVGEYIALVAAGALSLTDAAKLLRLRGRAMQLAADRLSAGQMKLFAMEALLMSSKHPTELEASTSVARIRDMCDEVQTAKTDQVAEVAADNSPMQVVIGGHATALAEVSARLKAARVVKRAVTLHVSAPFHTRLMKPAQEAVAHCLDQPGVLRDSRVPLICNVDGKPTTESERLKTALVQGITSTVNWRQSVGYVLSQFPGACVMELAPSAALSGMVKQCDYNGSCQQLSLTSLAEIDGYLKSLKG